MKAGLLLAVDEFVVEDVVQLPPGPRDAIVRIGASGVCHSDLSVMDGSAGLPTPVLLGHEGVGIVEWVGDEVTRVKVGDRVVASLTSVCNACWHCTRGETHLCEATFAAMMQPRVLHGDEPVPALAGLGTFAESMTSSELSLVPVVSDLPDEQLALLGCGVTTGLGAVLNTGRPEPGATVLVIGLGGVGTAALQGAKIAGASMLIAADPVSDKRSAAIGFGATHAIDPGEGPIADQVRALTGGRGVDLAVEAVGKGPLVEQALAATRRGGTTVLVGAAASDVQVSFSPMSLVVDDRTIKGCFYGRAQVQRDLPRFIRLAETGRLDLSSMVSRTIPLAEVGDALRGMGGREIRTVVV